MRHHPFGTTGLSVSEIGVGCSRLGGVFAAGSSPKEETDMLRQAMDAGVNLFDTADLYSHGQSEILLGKAIKGRRDEVVVATKVGYAVPAQSRLLGRLKPVLRPIVQTLGLKRPPSAGAPAGPISQDFSPSYLAAAVEASLKRLGTDRIDLYQLHSPPAAVVEAGEYLGALLELQAQGKIRHIGLAANHPADLAAFDRHPGVSALQTPYSALEPDAEAALLPRAETAGVGVISRSCFAAGLLVGDQDEAELRELTPDWEGVLRFRAVAEQLARPRAELALQFNLATPGVAVTILGMRTPAHLRANLAHLQAPPLADQERAAVRQAMAGDAPA